MVMTTLRQLIWVGLLCISSFSSFNVLAEPPLAAVSVSKTNIVLGDAVSLVIRGKLHIQAFEEQVAPMLAKDFALDVQEASSERLRLKLYALNTGNFVLPEVRFGDAVFPKTEVRVKNNPEVELQWQPLSTKAYVQQAMNLAYRLEFSSKEARLETVSEVFLPNQQALWRLEHFVSLDEPKLLGGKITEGVTLYHFQGLLPPIEAISKQLPTLHLKVRRANGRFWHFYSPSYAVEIQPLPSFLPASTLVGDLQWTQTFQQTFSRYQELNYLQWQLRVKNSDEAYLRNLAGHLLRQLEAAKGVEWLSPEIQTENVVEQGEVYQQLRVLLPFKPLQLVWQFPELQVRYFDDASAKLLVQTLPAGWMLSLPSYLYWLGYALLLVVAIAGLRRLILFWMLVYFSLRMQQQLHTSQTAKQVIEALFGWQTSLQASNKPLALERLKAGQGRDQGLGDWLAWYLSVNVCPQQAVKAQALIEALNRMLYAESDRESDKKPNAESQMIWQAALTDWLQGESPWKLAIAQQKISVQRLAQKRFWQKA